MGVSGLERWVKNTGSLSAAHRIFLLSFFWKKMKQLLHPPQGRGAYKVPAGRKETFKTVKDVRAFDRTILLHSGVVS